MTSYNTPDERICGCCGSLEVEQIFRGMILVELRCLDCGAGCDPGGGGSSSAGTIWAKEAA